MPIVSPPAFQLAICEVFHPILHGENETEGIHNHFLVYTVIDLPDFYSKAYLSEEHSFRRYRKAIHILHGSLDETHPTIRSYRKITKKYIRLEIIQADILAGQEEVAYLKTFWLRLVQRRWKKIYYARKEILHQRMSLAVLQERQRTGKWPSHLRTWPLFILK